MTPLTPEQFAEVLRVARETAREEVRAAISARRAMILANVADEGARLIDSVLYENEALQTVQNIYKD